MQSKKICVVMVNGSIFYGIGSDISLTSSLGIKNGAHLEHCSSVLLVTININKCQHMFKSKSRSYTNTTTSVWFHNIGLLN